MFMHGTLLTHEHLFDPCLKMPGIVDKGAETPCVLFCSGNEAMFLMKQYAKCGFVRLVPQDCGKFCKALV